MRLADSLEQIALTLDGALGADSQALGALIAAIRQHPVSPGVMALYAELAAAFPNDTETAVACLAALADPSWRRPAEARVITVRDADLGAGMAACYMRHLNDDPAAPVALRPLDDAALAGGRNRVAAAQRLLAAAAPDLAGEIAGVASEILLVAPGSMEGGVAFHGASSFYLWGALVLNLDAHPTRIRLIEGLAHESGHSVLHGLTLGLPTVSNDRTERYASPLRDDLRPIDGVVHATYVLARMHLALGAVQGAPGLTAAEREETGARLAAIKRDYADGLAVVTSAARFTPAGAAAFAGAEAYMRGIA